MDSNKIRPIALLHNDAIHFLPSKILRSNNGMALLYVLGALLVTTFLGAALMRMSNSDVVSATDYSGMTSAAISARSGMQAVEAKIENESPAVVTILNNYLANSSTNAFLGSSTTPIILDNQQKYYVNILGFDKANYVIQLEGTGIGKGGSRKKVIGLYDLGNLAFTTVTSYTGSLDKAIYLGGNTMIEAKLQVNGDVYSTGGLMFTDWSTGCVFNGSFICNGNIELRGLQTFNGVAYFMGDLVARSGGVAPATGSIFRGRTGIENTLTKPDAGAWIYLENEIYLNGASPQKVINNMYGNTYHHSGLINPVNIGNGVQDNRGSAINIRAALGITLPLPPQFNPSIIPASCIYTWAGGSYSADGLTAIYNNRVAANKLWNGFAVCKVEAGQWITICRGSSTFNNKIIILNYGDIGVTGSGDIGWPNCSNSSVTVIYNCYNLNWGQNIAFDDLFRGYIFNDPSSNSFFVGQAASVRLNRLLGGIHNMNPNNGSNWHPDDIHNSINVTVDNGLFSELQGIGLAGTGSVVTTTLNTVVLTGAQLTHTQLGMSF